MSQARTADVLVVANDCAPVTLRCLESVLRNGGPTLNRLIIVTSSPSAGALSRKRPERGARGPQGPPPAIFGRPWRRGGRTIEGLRNGWPMSSCFEATSR